jgi:hypothetical protein
MRPTQQFKGTLDIQATESFLDNTVMAMDDPTCADLDCKIQAARDHFVNAGCPTGSQLNIDGFLVPREPDGQGGFRDKVLHIVIDNSPCSGGGKI